jgi:hypothetical protein
MVIDHIGIKTSSIADLLQSFQCLSIISPIEIVDANDVGLKIAILDFNGIKIELLEVVSSNCPICSYPDGLNHIAFKVDDIQQEFEKVSLANNLKIESGITNGLHGKKVFFFSLQNHNDLLCECVECY